MTDSNWQSLSPFSIIYFIINFTVRFIKDGLINLAPAFAVFVTQVDDKLFWFSIAIVALIVSIITYSILFFNTFKFRVTNGEIILESGIVKKEHTTLKFQRVQNVNLSTPFYFAPLNLVNCIFDSAGSAQKEISLPGVNVSYAESVRTDVFDYKKQLTDAGIDDINELGEGNTIGDSTTNTEPTVTLSLVEIAKFGLSSNMTFLLLAVLAPFMETIVDYAKDSIIPSMSAALQTILPESTETTPLAVILFVIMVIGAAVCLSVCSAIIQFYKYQFFDQGDSLKRVAGLFDRHQISVSKHRVQSISIKKNWVFILLKRVTVQFHQLAMGKGNSAKNKSTLSIPTLHQNLWHDIVAKTYDDFESSKLNFIGISPRFLSHYSLLFWFLPISVMTLVLMQVNENWIVLLALLPVSVFCVFLRWRRFGIWFNDDFIAVRSGFLGYKISLIPIYKMQTVSYKQTPMLRRNNLATLVLQMPYGKVTVPFLAHRKAKALANLCAFKIESSTKHWL